MLRTIFFCDDVGNSQIQAEVWFSGTKSVWFYGKTELEILEQIKEYMRLNNE